MVSTKLYSTGSLVLTHFGIFILGSLEPLASPPNITAFCPTRLKVCPSLGQGGSPRGVNLLHSHLLASSSYNYTHRENLTKYKNQQIYLQLTLQ